MPTLKELKRRRKSIISTQQITRAVKLIAAAKLRRYSGIISEAREYSKYLNEMIERVLNSRITYQHPYLAAEGKGEDIALLFITSDKGLCGGYNSNLIKKAKLFLGENSGKHVHSVCIGKKGIEAFKKFKADVVYSAKDWPRMRQHQN